MLCSLVARHRNSAGRTARRLARALCVVGIVAAPVIAAGCAGLGVTTTNNFKNAETPAIVGSGKMVTRDFPLNDFNELEIDSTLRVDIARGDSYKVAITADDNAIDYVVAEKAGKTLKLALRSGSYMNSSFRATVSMPDLVGLQVAGASTSTLSGFKPRVIVVRLKGASQLLGRMEAGDVSLSVSESSNANLGGSAESLVLTASGAGQASLGDLVTGSAKVTMREASTATVSVKGKLDADLRSASNLYYVGNPSLGTITSLESSSVRRR